MLKQREPFSQRVREPIHIGTLTLPLLGSADDYPFDDYAAAGNWTVTVPDGTEIVFPGSIRIAYLLTPRIVMSPGAADLKWRWGNVPSIGLALEASRSISSQLFICVIVLLPLLLFLSVLLTLMPRRVRQGRASGRFPAELLVGVGAFLLAVLPVRAVLVPSNIPRLTVVDYALGTEMAVMVAATLMLGLASAQAHVETAPTLRGKSFKWEMPPTMGTPGPLTPSVDVDDRASGQGVSEKDPGGQRRRRHLGFWRSSRLWMGLRHRDTNGGGGRGHTDRPQR